MPVSYDGTWMRGAIASWGFRYNIGAGFVIDCETGFVIDFVVLSRNCKTCTTHRNAMSPEAFTEWEATYAPSCKKNFYGKFDAMEAEA